MRSTLIGMFDRRENAQRARDELLTAGFTEADISLRAQDSATTTARTEYADDSGGFGSWLRSLFGMDDDAYAETYEEALRRGNYLLTVEADGDAQIERATDVMERCGSIDVDEHSAQWRTQGWSSGTRTGDGAMAAGGSAYAGGSASAGTAAGQRSPYDVAARDAAAGRDLGATARGTSTRDTSETSETIPVVEESLQVGKRQVMRGGVRVWRRVVERPVEESVRLRDEHAHVERKKVDRPATENDLDGMREGSIEVRETREEPVVSKSARVTEEVQVGKTATERTQTVRDKVKRTDVEVEKLDESAAVARGRSGDGKGRPS